MDAKVWLVTQGEYSDYRVLGAFSTQEKAEAYVAAHNETASRTCSADGTVRLGYGSECSVEEYPLDAPAPEQPSAWVASFSWPTPKWNRDGNIYVQKAHGKLENGDEITRQSYGDYSLRFARPDREQAHRAAREMWRALQAGTFTLDALAFTKED